jgi:hypothetical protein
MPAKVQTPPEVPPSQPSTFSRAKIKRSFFKYSRAAAVWRSERQPVLQKLVDLQGCVAAGVGVFDEKRKYERGIWGRHGGK